MYVNVVYSSKVYVTFGPYKTIKEAMAFIEKKKLESGVIDIYIVEQK